MRAYSARHITRLASVNVQSTANMDFMEQVNFDQEFTNPKIFKIQMMVDQNCTVIINEHSRFDIDPRYGLLLDYTDMIIESMVIETDGVQIYAIVGY